MSQLEPVLGSSSFALYLNESAFGHIDGELLLADTGAQDMLVPEASRGEFIQRILNHIASQSGTEAGSKYIPTLDLTIFDCFFMRFLPPIELGLGEQGEATTTLTNHARKVDGTCFLAIKPAAGDRWTLPAFIMPGTYFEFRPSEGRLGVAKLRYERGTLGGTLLSVN
ncbi:hypothetical protein FOZ62_023926 [Perkinsus olseni]|uniref:Peptidase A1 domain-containing protein n=1 Tax=Perkinsus olseni TaxID=32597 RepID=A0A7J6NA62_PEROL|nr:hypothetical protein FOZ62_023926 [Perkinsus olseni]